DLYRFANRNIKLHFVLKSLQKTHGDNLIIIVFRPSTLNIIPKSIKKKNAIVLVQTRRMDMIFKKLSDKYSFSLNSDYIDAVTVYTDNDKSKLIKIYPFIKTKTVIIQRTSTLDTSKNTEKFSSIHVTIAKIREKVKNFCGLVDIFKNLPSYYSLEIYGDGPEEELNNLRKIIQPYNNITFMGVSTDVKKSLKRNAIFVMTSRHEGFGQTLIEARSQGLPIIAYNTFPAASWIVRDGKNGYLIEQGNIKEFVQKIKYLECNPEVFKEFSKKSLELAKETQRDTIQLKWEHLLSSL